MYCTIRPLTTHQTHPGHPVSNTPAPGRRRQKPRQIIDAKQIGMRPGDELACVGTARCEKCQGVGLLIVSSWAIMKRGVSAELRGMADRPWHTYVTNPLVRVNKKRGIHIYIYLYIYVCVCVFVCISRVPPQ